MKIGPQVSIVGSKSEKLSFSLKHEKETELQRTAREGRNKVHEKRWAKKWKSMYNLL